MATQSLKQLGTAEFKQLIGATNVDIIVNPNGGKLFANASNGKNYKVQQAIDFSKAIVVIVPLDADENMILDEACFINKSSEGVKITL